MAVGFLAIAIAAIIAVAATIAHIRSRAGLEDVPAIESGRRVEEDGPQLKGIIENYDSYYRLVVSVRH